VRLTFVGIALAYVVQYFVVMSYGEPYPALMMPTFRGTGGYHDGKVRIKRMEAVFVTAEGDSSAFSRRDLLSEFPVSFHQTIANTFLAPLPEAARTRARIPILPGLRAGEWNRTSAANLASLRAWLLARGRTLLPGRSLERVELRWYEDTVRQEAGQLTTQRRSIGEFVVDLGGKPQ
jgi:hypothetical protein